MPARNAIVARARISRQSYEDIIRKEDSPLSPPPFFLLFISRENFIKILDLRDVDRNSTNSTHGSRTDFHAYESM